MSPRTIDTFITHLRNKLKGFELIKTIPRKGYKFNEDFLKKIKKNENINNLTLPSIKGDLI